MAGPLISIIIPTVQGREDHLERCVAAYRATTGVPFEFVVLRDYATCGEAWQVGAARARGGYLHFTADDLEPLEGWHAAAILASMRGELPAAAVYQGNGRWTCGEHWHGIPAAGTHMRCGTVPFMSRAAERDIGPSLPIHYYTDNWFSYRGRVCGYPTVATPRYAFRHYWAQPGRGAGMTQEQRMEHDRTFYLEAGGTL